MPKKVNDKRKALLEATLRLVSNHGFHNAPMSKIAQLADVSAGTIYLYFDNKQDLVDSLYLEIKAAFTDAAFQGYSEGMPVKQGFEHVWHNMVEYKMSNPMEATVLSRCDNAPIISEAVREKALKHLQPLLDLWQRGQQQGVVRQASPYLLYAYAVYPLSFLVAVEERGEHHLSEELRQETFEMAWSAIKA